MWGCGGYHVTSSYRLRVKWRSDCLSVCLVSRCIFQGGKYCHPPSCPVVSGVTISTLDPLSALLSPTLVCNPGHVTVYPGQSSGRSVKVVTYL